MNEAVQDLFAQLETVQVNRNTTVLPKTPPTKAAVAAATTTTTTTTTDKETPPTIMKDRPPPPTTNFPSIAQVMVRHQVVNDFIPPTHYHAALGPPPGREADLFHRGPLSSSPPPHPAMRSRSTITTTTPRSYSSTTPGTASAGSNIKKDKPASDNYNSRDPPPPTLGTGSAYRSSTEENLLVLQLELDQITKQIDTLYESSGSVTHGAKTKRSISIVPNKSHNSFSVYRTIRLARIPWRAWRHRVPWPN